MNKMRRKEIASILISIRNIQKDLDKIIQDEQVAFDSIPENLQCTNKGCESEEAIDQMQDASECLEEAIDFLDYIV